MLRILGKLPLGSGRVLDEVLDWRDERPYRQRARADTIRCDLRVVDGALRGLSRLRWTPGKAQVAPGSLWYEPDSVWRSRSTIPVRSAALQPPWDVPRGSPLATGPQSRRIVLETDRATLEWLVPEEQLQRSMGVVRRSTGDAGPPTG